ncbi:ion transporter [Thermostaphylospora chromogena]|uniref:ion transporter n=1 Tax=Thermostaphylospora chromogena TaxID=35622 RepID=UPI001F603488|nr:ion transporter [Thermostaphylospora chromogena]
MRALLERRYVERIVIAVIVLNAITIGLETSPALVDRFGVLLHLIDRVALTIFVAELAIRLYGYGVAFFKEPWNWFDTAVVGAALIPAATSLSVLRALRILRAARLISAVPSMRKVVGALLAALPSMVGIIGLLVLILYIAAVLATELFGDVVPEHFGDLPVSLFSLFQTLTGEGWPDIAGEVMEERPWAWVFFVGYILISTFVVLNLFTGVVVNALDDQNTSAEERRVEERLDAIMTELALLRAKLEAVDGERLDPASDEGTPTRTGFG